MLSLQVAELVTSEFFEQGDRERLELKLTPSVSKRSRLRFCAFLQFLLPSVTSESC